MYTDLKLRNKLLLGFSILLLLLTGYSVFSILELMNLNNTTKNLYNHPFTVSNNIQQAEAQVYRIRMDLNDLLLSESRDEIEIITEDIRESRQVFTKNFEIARRQYLGDKEAMTNVYGIFSEWEPVGDEIISLFSSGQREAAKEIARGKSKRYMIRLLTAMTQLRAFAYTKAGEFIATAEKNAQSVYLLSGILIILAIIIGVIITLFTTGNIVTPVVQIMNNIKNISDGDLTVAMERVSRRDEIGQLHNSFAQMLNTIRSQVKQTINAINVITTSNTQIAATVSELSASSSQISAAVNETSATVNEVNQTINLSNDKAIKVSEIAQKTEEISISGENAVKNTSLGMQGIKDQMGSIANSIVRLSNQSQAIAKIISFVEDLADQSNLLAVNAAIEAVKAGDQGKGFVIVAQEIRKLAEQSKQSTEKIRNILDEILHATSQAVMATENGTKAVENGVLLSQSAGASIRELSENIALSAHAAIQIAASSKEQKAGMEQVTIAIENINQATAQNVLSVKQLEQASSEINKLGNQLQQLIDWYKL